MYNILNLNNQFGYAWRDWDIYPDNYRLPSAICPSTLKITKRNYWYLGI